MVRPPGDEITVAICTRNRQGAACTPVAAVLDGTYRHVRVLVIDQSNDNSTESALSGFLSDPRFEYHRCRCAGVSRARNHALVLATGPLVLFTDDDCEPGKAWVSDMVKAASEKDGAFIIFGPLLPHPRAATTGIVPSWMPKASTIRRSGISRCLGGVTANAGLSREAISKVGLFNPVLGRGTRLNAGEDYEYTLRLLARGGYIVELTSPSVQHLGVVPPNCVRQWLRHDLVAAGTMIGWQCRSGNRYALPQFVHLFLKEARPAAAAAMKLRRPAGLVRAAWIAHGFVTGLAVRPPRPSSESTIECILAGNWGPPEGDATRGQPAQLMVRGG